jgi:hypothetical protein
MEQQQQLDSTQERRKGDIMKYLLGFMLLQDTARPSKWT